MTGLLPGPQVLDFNQKEGSAAMWEMVPEVQTHVRIPALPLKDQVALGKSPSIFICKMRMTQKDMKIG